MDTPEHSNQPVGRDSFSARIHPGHLSVLAILLCAPILVFAPGNDACSDYAGKHALNALVAAALVTQGGSLVFAICRCVAGVKGSLGGLVASIVLSILALPAAFFLLLVINGFLCD
jgi:hypothetical protein